MKMLGEILDLNKECCIEMLEDVRLENIKKLCEAYPTMCPNRVMSIYDDSFSGTKPPQFSRPKARELLGTEKMIKLRHEFAFSRTNVMVSFESEPLSETNTLYLKWMELQFADFKKSIGN